MHNIAEGCDAGTDAEFVRFLKIARRSCSEVQSQLYLALDLKYITEAELKPAYHLDDEVKRLINGLIAYLQNDNQVGHSTKQIRELPASYPTTDYSTLRHLFHFAQHQRQQRHAHHHAIEGFLPVA